MSVTVILYWNMLLYYRIKRITTMCLATTTTKSPYRHCTSAGQRPQGSRVSAEIWFDPPCPAGALWLPASSRFCRSGGTTWLSCSWGWRQWRSPLACCQSAPWAPAGPSSQTPAGGREKTEQQQNNSCMVLLTSWTLTARPQDSFTSGRITQ